MPGITTSLVVFIQQNNSNCHLEIRKQSKRKFSSDCVTTQKSRLHVLESPRNQTEENRLIKSNPCDHMHLAQYRLNFICKYLMFKATLITLEKLFLLETKLHFARYFYLHLTPHHLLPSIEHGKLA